MDFDVLVLSKMAAYPGAIFDFIWESYVLSVHQIHIDNYFMLRRDIT